MQCGCGVLAGRGRRRIVRELPAAAARPQHRAEAALAARDPRDLAQRAAVADPALAEPTTTSARRLGWPRKNLRSGYAAIAATRVFAAMFYFCARFYFCDTCLYGLRRIGSGTKIPRIELDRADVAC